MLQRTRGSPRYHLFILAAWEEESSPPGPVVWRYSLEQSATGERRGFRHLEELMAYLAACTHEPPPMGGLIEPNRAE
ncbi:MAG: hypothetical protein R2911_34595 [Caldilineaceae bacterium]